MLTSSRNSAKIRKMNHDGIPLGFKIWFGFVIFLMITILIGIWSSIGWVFFHVVFFVITLVLFFIYQMGDEYRKYRKENK